MVMPDEKFMTASPDIYTILRDNAKCNRRNMTLAESVLWDSLRQKFPYCHFRRQHAIGDYIVDFVCLSQQLIVEVDGEYHNSAEQRCLDNLRTDFLTGKGFRIIRFTNQQVFNQINDVIAAIGRFFDDCI